MAFCGVLIKAQRLHCSFQDKTYVQGLAEVWDWNFNGAWPYGLPGEGRGEWEGIHCPKLYKAHKHPQPQVSPPTGAGYKQHVPTAHRVDLQWAQLPTVCPSDEVEKIGSKIASHH